MPSRFKRGELHWGSVLEVHHIGTEQHNEVNRPRPWLIVSDGRTLRRKLVITCPTSRTLDPGPTPQFRVTIEPGAITTTPDDPGLHEPCMLLVEQVRAMSIDRFKPIQKGGGNSRIGKLNPATQARVDRALSLVLGL